MYIYIHIYIYIYMCDCLYTYIYIHTCICMYLCLTRRYSTLCVPGFLIPVGLRAAGLFGGLDLRFSDSATSDLIVLTIGYSRAYFGCWIQRENGQFSTSGSLLGSFL